MIFIIYLACSAVGNTFAIGLQWAYYNSKTSLFYLENRPISVKS